MSIKLQILHWNLFRSYSEYLSSHRKYFDTQSKFNLDLLVLVSSPIGNMMVGDSHSKS